MRFASAIWVVYFASAGPTATGAARDGWPQPVCRLNLTHCDDTKSSMRRDGSGIRASNWMGKFTMKLFGSGSFGRAIKVAGVAAALMLSASAGHAQSGPFAGFSGSWSGNGTVALSDGTIERIRCKADYKVNGNGLGLKQSLIAPATATSSS